MTQPSSAPQEVELPQDLAALAEEKGWPLEVVRGALAQGFPLEQIRAVLEAGITPEQIAKIMPAMAALRQEKRQVTMQELTFGRDIPAPAELRRAAEQQDWPLEMVEMAVRRGFPPQAMLAAIEAGLRPEQVSRLMAAAMASGVELKLGLEWMDAPTERGMKIRPGKKGLTVGSLNVGSYGEIPDRWPYDTFLPRGAAPLGTTLPGLGYSVFDKADVWAEEAADLYEEGIQRRWGAARDIPWESLEPLPEELERAVCQVCTELSERGYAWHMTIAKWLPQISYGFHEVKLMLAEHVFCAGRMHEAFRKRALANGGGLGTESPGIYYKQMTDSRSFPQVSIALHLVHASFTHTLLQFCEACANNEAEQLLFRLMGQDVARMLAYGIGHLRFLLAKQPERLPEVEQYLAMAEFALVRDEHKNVPLREALIILAGRGDIAAGHKRFQQLRRRQVSRYLDRLDAAGVDRKETINRRLKEWLD
ncbi:MAG: hypothetical protein Q7R32_14415 [Dehalococcoidia bacterium]|nr:hypothetical protein [Dehalococcoidia bacterium]